MNCTPIEWPATEAALKSAGYKFAGMEDDIQWVETPEGERLALSTDGDQYWV